MPHSQDAGDSSAVPPERRQTAQRAEEPAVPVLALQKNDPDPFRGETTIAYQIDEPSRVRLCVYDLFGRHLKTLVDATQEPDDYTITFDGQALAGGTYLYRLETTAGVETRRMTLVR